MPGYMLEIDVPLAMSPVVEDDGTRFCRILAQDDTARGVAWVELYLSSDRRKSYCVYYGPSQEAVRHVAASRGLSVTAIMEVQVAAPSAGSPRGAGH